MATKAAPPSSLGKPNTSGRAIASDQDSPVSTWCREGCREGAERVSGGCGEGVGWVRRGRGEGVERVSRGCGEGAERVRRGCRVGEYLKEREEGARERAIVLVTDRVPARGHRGDGRVERAFDPVALQGQVRVDGVAAAKVAEVVNGDDGVDEHEDRH